MGYGKRKRSGASWGGAYGYGAKRSRNSSGGSSFSATRYRGGGGAGYRTGGFNGTEVKFFDTALTETAIAPNLFAQTATKNPPGIGCLFAPASGTGAADRTGRAVLMKRITLKGTITSTVEALATNEVPAPVTVRFLMVQDTQNNHQINARLNPQADGVLTNVLKSTTPFDADNTVNAFIDLENARRFKILADRTFTINPNNQLTGGGTGNSGSQFRKFVIDKAVNIPVLMTNAGNDLTGISDNAVYCYALCNNNAQTDSTQTATINYVCRVRFTDA